MSDTPRTDAAELEANIGVTHFDHKDLSAAYHFTRQLERELNAASKERDDALMMLGMYRMKSDEQKERIKRLEEAGGKMERWCSDWEAASNWEKAKEAKL